KILVDKENWHEVAPPRPGVRFLEPHPDGSVIIWYGKLKAYLGTNGKVEKVGPVEVPVVGQAMAKTNTASYSIQDSKSVVASVGGKSVPLRRGGLAAPACLTLWREGGHFVLGGAPGGWLWAVRIEADGTLGRGDRYYSLRTKPGEAMKVTAMTMDAAGL